MDSPPNLPTPDYGTLGPGSDIKIGPDPGIKLAPTFRFGASAPASTSPRQARPATGVLSLMLVGMMVGMFFYAQSSLRTAQRNSRTLRSMPLTATRSSNPTAQREAEQLLQRATVNDSSARAQIEARAPAWQGHITLTPQLTNLITAGLNARDLRVRSATIELDLAAMNIAQDNAAADRLIAQSASPDRATRIWALWALGLLANRGIQRDAITALLTVHLGDSDPDSRHWAVEALSYVGTDAVIPPLLKTMHDDASPMVRERAACALAESGMLTPQQRRAAIPTLLAYTDDPSLDAPTHSWTYHALRDITAQNLPDNPTAWKSWYKSSH